MAPKSHFLLLTMFSLLFGTLLLDVSAGTGGRKVGGWQPIKDPKDPEILQIGQFAVTEHNKQAQTNLKFETVVRGETQVVAGTNYKLVIAAKDGAISHNYEAVVWDKPWEKFRNLTSFRLV